MTMPCAGPRNAGPRPWRLGNLVTPLFSAGSPMSATTLNPAHNAASSASAAPHGPMGHKKRLARSKVRMEPFKTRLPCFGGATGTATRHFSLCPTRDDVSPPRPRSMVRSYTPHGIHNAWAPRCDCWIICTSAYGTLHRSTSPATSPRGSETKRDIEKRKFSNNQRSSLAGSAGSQKNYHRTG